MDINFYKHNFYSETRKFLQFIQRYKALSWRSAKPVNLLQYSQIFIDSSAAELAFEELSFNLVITRSSQPEDVHVYCE